MLTLGSAYARFENGRLEVNTGRASRVWQWTGAGFATTEMSFPEQGVVYRGSGAVDYAVFGIGDGEECRLHSVRAYAVDDGYTSKYIETEAIIYYPRLAMTLKYVIGAYPDAAGFRTQLFVKSQHGFAPFAAPGESVAETVCLPNATKLKAIGYYNDTQHRNEPDTEILEERDYTGNQAMANDWASVMALFDGDQGLCVVKESIKCVNQPAYDTGGFTYDGQTLKSTGIGLKPEDLLLDNYLFAWASWTVFFAGGEDGLQAELKAYDRLRFPVDKKRDIYIMANTWGNTGDGKPSSEQSGAASVLRDLAVAAELGLDVLQVDAGWHTPEGTNTITTKDPYYTHVDKYPGGWDMITEPAKKWGITLGLWFEWLAPVDEMIDNVRQGGFRYLKIDFVNHRSRRDIDYLVDKARRLMEAFKGGIRINWDVTEHPARIGYYFGREFGNIYLANRKPVVPKNVIYRPHLVLRDAWQIAKYVNLNKFQVTLQNLDLIDRDISDAYRHNFPYCALIAFMGSPILFQQVQYLSEKAKGEIKDMITVYKKHREDMFDSYVYPIGSKPDGQSWAGFQFVKGEQGHIVLFRELNNQSASETIGLKFIKGREISLCDVLTGRQTRLAVDGEGRAAFSIPEPCGFAWYTYSV
jgi:hypothetical protein